MSLFGESPPRAKQTKSSLFDEDEPSSKGGSGGLFADDGGANDSAPWDFPAGKKQQRGNLVKNLLQGTDVPEQYVDAYDNTIANEGSWGKGVSLEAARKLVGASGISSGDQERVLQIVGGDADGLTRPEFNVLLALIGLAQEGEEFGLDAVDERKTRLPVPSLPSLKPASRNSNKPGGQPQSGTGASGRPQTARDASFGASLDSDPWGSPALHKGHDHANQNGSYPNGATSVAERPATRTTSTFTTSASEQAEPSTSSFEHSRPSAGGDGAGWGGDAGFGAPSAEHGFGNASDGEGAGSNGMPRSLGAGKRTGTSIEEEVTVNLLEEKEGMFMFQHRNYEVVSTRKNSKVVRRYSDFVWLLDCLYKRYPFRQLPLLPPKRVASKSFPQTNKRLRC